MESSKGPLEDRDQEEPGLWLWGDLGSQKPALLICLLCGLGACDLHSDHTEPQCPPGQCTVLLLDEQDGMCEKSDSGPGTKQLNEGLSLSALQSKAEDQVGAVQP